MSKNRSFTAARTALIIGCASLTMVLPASPVASQQEEFRQGGYVGDTGIYAKNVARVDYAKGSMRQMAEKEWHEYDANGNRIAIYDMIFRGEWIVELHDRASPVVFTIDMLQGNVHRRIPAEGGQTYYDVITSATPMASMPKVAMPVPKEDWEKELVQKRFVQAPVAPWKGADARSMIPETVAPTAPPSQSNPGGWQNQQAPQNTGQGGWQSQQPPQNAGQGGWANQQPPQNTGQGGWQNQQPPQNTGQGGWAQQQGQNSNAGGWPSQPQNNTSNGFPAQSSGGNTRDNPFRPSGPTNTGGGDFQPQGPVQQAEDFAELYSGIWVQRDFRIREQGDGLETAVTWVTPKVIRFEKLSPTALGLRHEENPLSFHRLNKASDTVFSGGGVTVRFNTVGSSLYLTINGHSAISGAYEMAKTTDGVFSKDRFTDTSQTDRRERFSLDGIAREWNTNLFGYDGLKVNLDRVRDGQKAMVFQRPGNRDLSLDDNLGLAVPFGLRGERVRDSSMKGREAIVTRASEYQRSYSLNFGSGSPFGATSTSMEFTNGASSSLSTMKAVSYVNVERYALILDKPNIMLSDSFRQAVDQLASRQMTESSFIQRFGTHYARAVTYGGIAKAEKTMTSEEVKKWSSQSVNTSASGAFKGMSAGVGGGTSLARSNMKSSVFTNTDFQGRGGTGGGSLESWQVDDNNTVPVRYDLQYLSDLISPAFFDFGADQAKARQYTTARARLNTAITNYMSSAKFSPAFVRAYELEVQHITCSSAGDDKDKKAEVSGQIIIEMPENEKLDSVAAILRERAIYCNGSGQVPINDKMTVSDPKSFTFRIKGSDLVEFDYDPFKRIDPDDKITSSSDKYYINIANEARSTQWTNKTVTLSGNSNAPRLIVHYRMRKMF
ncbi:MAG: MAC/perforin domain-containing protein [Erythrobacter sp.]